MFYVEIDGSDLRRALAAIKRVSAGVRRENSKLPRRCAVEVRGLLAEAIMSNKYAAGYRPYSSHYRKWKQRQGYPMIFWKLSGDLLGALQVFRYEGEWTAGIPSGVMSSTAGKRFSNKSVRTVPVAMYANIMEYGANFRSVGGGKHPSRPLFRPMKVHYGISRDFKKQADKTIIALARKWR